MKNFPKSLSQKLQQREHNLALRKLSLSNDLIDFSFIYDKSQNKVVPLQQLINNLSSTLEEVSKSLEDVKKKVENMQNL